MPSFTSFLRTSKRMSLQVDHSNGDLGLDGAGMKQKRRSKFDTLRGLLRRSARKPQAPTRQSVQSLPVKPHAQVSESVEKPQYPILEPVKPLPPASAAVRAPSPEPTLPPEVVFENPEAPLSLPDLHKLFSGAPHFFAISEEHNTGAPHPSVAFPWDADIAVRDLIDHNQIEDEAWSCVTAWPHTTRGVFRDSKIASEHEQKNRPKFVPRCQERPNMLNMNGLERGSSGFQAALEFRVADAFVVTKEDTVDGLKFRSESRKKSFTGKEGLRPVYDSILIERLTSLSTAYVDDVSVYQRPPVELYTELFTQVLFPPSRVIDADDPYGLRVQAEALITVLANPTIWIDFSLVEWRIRLGNILWGPLMEDMTEDEITTAGELGNDPSTEKYWLLLQIMLSCELLVRLDTLSATSNDSTLQDVHRFHSKTTNSVNWSLLLARQWLENIRLEKISSPVEKTESERQTTGWLGAFTRPAANKPSIGHGIDSVRFVGRYQTRQVSGLIHFARELKWPNLDSLTAKITANGILISESTHNTPMMGTPVSMSTQRSSSYFASRRPRIRRGLSTQQRISSVMQPSGWLSNSYISNLVLPGEGLSHFLISTLLENDETAIAKLGEDANLYCGFSYEGRSFWSTSCVVGRVLAAGQGASECMGWIASPIYPNGPAGWLDIDIKQNVDVRKCREEARIWHNKELEYDRDVIGGADALTVFSKDLILPADNSSCRTISVIFEALDLLPTDATSSTGRKELADQSRPSIEDGEIHNGQTQSAKMRFSIKSDGEEKKIELPLQNDVYFVTAHPCLMSRHIELLKLPRSPPQLSNAETTVSRGTQPGHPLHKSFKYVITDLFSLLFASSRLSLSALLEPTASILSKPARSGSRRQKSRIRNVLVIECTETSAQTIAHRKSKDHTGSDLEMLARAYCAERGWNALISRKRRGCLACSIREAEALGWRVVLRM